jgi:hypothetical protein
VVQKGDPAWPSWTGHWCLLCKKWADQSHLQNSAEHRQKVDEMAAGDALIGYADTTRRFQSDSAGLSGFLTKENMRCFWGRDLDKMPNLTWDRLRQNSTFEASLPGWGRTKKQLSYSDLSNITLCSATYTGAGKYVAGVDYCLTWEDTNETLIDPTEGAKLQTFRADTGRGYWPVCWVTWHSEREDVGFWGSEADYRTAQRMGVCPVWVICWYQLFDSSWVMCLWPVYLRSRL